MSSPQAMPRVERSSRNVNALEVAVDLAAKGVEGRLFGDRFGDSGGPEAPMPEKLPAVEETISRPSDWKAMPSIFEVSQDLALLRGVDQPQPGAN